MHAAVYQSVMAVQEHKKIRNAGLIAIMPTIKPKLFIFFGKEMEVLPLRRPHRGKGVPQEAYPRCIQSVCQSVMEAHALV